MITGGWNFVVASYAVAYGVLLVYGLRLVLRVAREKKCRSKSP